MSIIKYHQPLKALLSVKGHPYERDALMNKQAGQTNFDATRIPI